MARQPDRATMSFFRATPAREKPYQRDHEKPDERDCLLSVSSWQREASSERQRGPTARDKGSGIGGFSRRIW